MGVLVLALLFLAFAFASGYKRDYYDVLNLKPTATRGQIKKAFRRLALKFHPDKNKSAEAEARFREIAEAYKVLSSCEERNLYDLLGHKAYVNGDGFFYSKGDFHDMDKDFHDMDKDFHDMDKDFHDMIKDFHNMIKDFHNMIKDFYDMVKDFDNMVKDVRWTFPDDDVYDPPTFNCPKFTSEEEPSP